jgi:hypothetical protein
MRALAVLAVILKFGWNGISALPKNESVPLLFRYLAVKSSGL